MKKFTFVMIVCILGISTAYADERDTYCASLANHKNLMGKPREEFIAKCVLSSPEERHKLENCAAAANHKNLVGKQREGFILKCMEK
jgi:hypothetical protein